MDELKMGILALALMLAILLPALLTSAVLRGL